jgi:muramoyltetrapeptide carboxypeptidase
VDAVMAVRGGYGSVEMLPWLDADALRRRPVALVGYSDITSLHAVLNTHVGITSVHGPMIDGRLARGETKYDVTTFLASLTASPLGELSPEGIEVLRAGEAGGPLFGGTLTQLVSALGTPYDFAPPQGYVLFVEDVGERPYRLRRMLTHLRLAGRLATASAIVFGEMTRCDEDGGQGSARAMIADCLADFPGPVLFGFPSGHTPGPFLSLPFGVHATVVAAGASPRVVMDEAAAG